MTDRAALELAIVRAMEAVRNPVRWGKDDCSMWAANILADELGYDPAKTYRDRYRSKRGARRVLGRMGLAFAIRKIAKDRQWARIKPDAARPGDIGLILIRHPGKKAQMTTVICRAPGWFVARADRGASLISASLKDTKGRFVIRPVWSVL